MGCASHHHGMMRTNLESKHETLDEATAYRREKGFCCQHVVSKTHVVLWCSTNPARPERGYTPICRAKVHVWYVQSMSPGDVGAWQLNTGGLNGDRCCYHKWDGKVPSFGPWLSGGVQEIMHKGYVETNLRMQDGWSRLSSPHRTVSFGGANVGQGALSGKQAPAWTGTGAIHSQQYVEQRSNWAVGDSPASIRVATPSKPHANMLKPTIASPHLWNSCKSHRQELPSFRVTVLCLF